VVSVFVGLLYYQRLRLGLIGVLNTNYGISTLSVSIKGLRRLIGLYGM
jgi:hypothetical protein